MDCHFSVLLATFHRDITLYVMCKSYSLIYPGKLNTEFRKPKMQKGRRLAWLATPSFHEFKFNFRVPFPAAPRAGCQYIIFSLASGAHHMHTPFFADCIRTQFAEMK